VIPSLPDPHAIAAMALTVFALFLFTRERIPMETTSLIILIAVALGFELFPYPGIEPADFLHGFGHEALITICALMIVGRALETTGALEPVAMSMARMWSSYPSFSLLLTLIFTAVLSSLMNNTPIVVMLMPILIGIGLRTGTPASATLMPVGLATLIGGSGSTIGTSTNLLVVAVAADLGMRRFEMFDFSMPVLIAGSFGVLFLWLVAPRLLPQRVGPLSDTSPRIFDAVLFVNADSFANGRTLAEILEKTERKMKIERIQRGEDLLLVKLPTVVLQTGDHIYISDTPENLKKYEKLLGATLHNVSDIEHPVSEEHPLSTPGQQLAEVVITDASLLKYRSLKQARFTERFRLVVLAIHRARTTVPKRKTALRDIVLRTGDVLLLQGPSERIQELKRSGELLVLDATTDLPRTRKAPLALAIFCIVVGMAATGLLPISVSALLGTGLVLLTGCLNWRDAAGALSTPVIMIIVASLALGLALSATGAADYLAQLLVAMTAGLAPVYVMSGLMLLMAVLSNVVSHNAAAVIGTPIAIGIAEQLGSPPETFVLAVMFGANMGYATPIGYQTNVLILNAGGYKFIDFMRVGVPLTIIMWLAFSFLLPVFFEI
jgi:di/tricarboxylate transporter